MTYKINFIIKLNSEYYTLYSSLTLQPLAASHHQLVNWNFIFICWMIHKEKGQERSAFYCSIRFCHWHFVNHDAHLFYFKRVHRILGAKVKHLLHTERVTEYNICTKWTQRFSVVNRLYMTDDVNLKRQQADKWDEWKLIKSIFVAIEWLLDFVTWKVWHSELRVPR